jgi:P4 family phage/plasmid primase-like protien
MTVLSPERLEELVRLRRLKSIAQTRLNANDPESKVTYAEAERVLAEYQTRVLGGPANANAGSLSTSKEEDQDPLPEAPDAREQRLRAMEGADLSKLSDEQLAKETKELEAFCTSFDQPRKAERRRREIEITRRKGFQGRASNTDAAQPKPAAPKVQSGDGKPSQLTEALFWTVPVHFRCGPECKSARGRVTGAWAYLESKGLDPNLMPASVVARPYLFPPRGALLGLATDDAGTVQMAEAILITKEGLPAEWHGSNKWKRVGKDANGKHDKSWFKTAAVRMAARNGAAAAPIVLCEGITTALAIWQSRDDVTVWALLGSKRWHVIPVPDDRDLILAIDADHEDSPGHADAQWGIRELQKRRSFKVARPDGTDGYDWCDARRDLGPQAVAAGIAAAETIEHEPAAEGGAEAPSGDFVIVSAVDHMGRAGKFISLERGHLKHYRDDFYDHRDGRYVPLDDDAIKTHLYRFLDAALTRNKKGELVPFCPGIHSVSETMAATRAHTYVNSDRELPCWLDGRSGPNPEDLICFPNGILDIRTGAFSPPDPMLFTTSAVGFEYDPAAPSPVKWINFLDQIYDGDDDQIGGLQEMFGYCISNDVSQEKAFGWIGPKRSGKDTKRRMLCTLLPANAVCGPTLGSLGTEPFGMEPLLHKQLAIVGDMRLGKKTDKNLLAENLLKLTGRGLFTVGRKFKAPWHGMLPCKLLLISNVRLMIPDASGAVASRIITFTTQKSFYGKEDPQLFARDLRPEAPGVLLWALEGLRRMRERGRLHEPASSVEERDALERGGSPVMAFVKDCCSLENREAEIATDKLYGAYKDYAAANNLFSRDKSWFVRDLKSASGERVKEKKLTIGGERVPGLRGIQIVKQPEHRDPAGGMF